MIENLSELVEGDYEILPIHLFSTQGNPEDYPIVYKILSGLDCNQLLKDYEQVLGQSQPGGYIKQREGHFGSTDKETRRLLIEHGFEPGKYKALGLVKTGTSELLEIIPQYTRNMLLNLPGKFFRPHYSAVVPQWKCAWHGDGTDYKKVGFRVTIPINVPAHYSFLVNGKEMHYELEPGNAWFVNFCYPHQVVNPYLEDRICLIFQLDSDLWLSKNL